MNHRISNSRILYSLLLTGFLLFIAGISAIAQEKCAIKPFQELQNSRGLQLEDTRAFEEWMAEKLQEMRSGAADRTLPQSLNEVITIPVVVHVIHEGENLGSGTNLPREQIISQIDVLNEDFRRLNADRTNTPPEFTPVAADIEVNFALAVRDPEGLPTDGIVRVEGNQNIWQLTDNYKLKNLSYWPSEDYLNIWVADLNDNYLGYAQFPVSPLAGLDIASENEFTDGVIIDYRAFGSISKYPDANLISSYNQGRTATHEVGHFLGLRHIWGDGGCEVDDFCADTPDQGSPNTNIGEPCTFPGPNSCNSGAGDLPDMFQNYMDYTHDVCMNLFTVDQRFRMRAVLDESPRRASLKNSQGLIPPVQFATDLGIRTVVNPSSYACSDPFIPSLEVRNYGTNLISSFEISQEFNGLPQGTRTFTITLAPLETAMVTMPDLNPANDGNITFQITSVNGSADENTSNNIKSKTIKLSDEIDGPIDLNFNSLPDNWIIDNPDGLIKWETISAPNGNGVNRALYMDFYDYENYGELDYFVSPVIDLADAQTALLNFDIAYSGYPSIESNFEGLLITASPECGDPLYESDTLFYKVGSDLRTTNSRSTEFFPADANDWRTETVNLLPYLGGKVRLAFIGINGYGNNLFLDNIRVDLGSSILLESPGPAYCIDRDPPFTFLITNTSSEPWNYFELELKVDEIRLATYVFNGTLPSGESVRLETDPLTLSRGYHLIDAFIGNINNTGADLGASGQLSRRFITSDKEVSVPFRENFSAYDPELPAAWLFLTQPGTPGWNLVTTPTGEAAALNNQNNNNPGDLNYLLSPKFSLQNARDAFLTFDLAYKRINDSFDAFSILLSTDCGLTFDEVLFSRTGNELGFNDFNGLDVPSTPSDWEKITLNLSSYAGLPDLKLAFLGINGNGGSLFVDNIEFFINDPVVAGNGTVFTNPTVNGFFKVTFNRPEKERIRLRLMDMTGRVVLDREFNNVLNQTYEFDVNYLKQGVYIIQVEGETFSMAKRLIHAYF